MTNTAESLFRFYSLGIVVETKPDNTDYILVTPIEVLNIQKSGSIKESKTVFEGKANKSDKASFNTQVSSTNYLKAKWISLNSSNRLSSPDVVKNETVLIYKFGDVDEYYWTTIFTEVELRRQEKVIYGYSNLKSGITKFNRTTSYWVEVDTKAKFVHLHTSDNDGEATEYDIRIDTHTGILTIKDKRNNSIVLESVADKYNITTNNEINLKTSNTVNIVSGVSVNIVAGSDINLTAPNIVITGNLSVKGNVNSTGSVIDTSGNTNHHVH